jgi:hypothetical protein
MADPNLRWRQRFDNFQRALQVLERGVDLACQRPLSELEHPYRCRSCIAGGQRSVFTTESDGHHLDQQGLQH